MDYRRYVIHIPFFSEYLFRLFCTLTEDQKKGLTDMEKKWLKDKASISHFVSNRPLEHLLFMYLKTTGDDFCIEFGPNRKEIAEAIESTEYQYDSNVRRIDAIQTIMLKNVCVFSSREIMQTAIMCSQNCATEVYNLNTQTLGMMQKNPNKRPYNKVLSDANDAVLNVNKLLLEQLNTLSYAQEVLGLDTNELRILSALFERKNGAMSMREIAQITRQENKVAYIGRFIERLEKAGMIITDREKEKKGYGIKLNYMITTKGIKKILDYHYIVWEKAFGDK